MRWLVFAFSWLAVGVFAAPATADRTIILDDGPDGAPAIALVGDWHWRPESGTSEKPNSYLGTGSRFAFAGAPVKTATYAPNFTYDGLWEASLWWPTFGWTNNALVQVNHTGGTHDQRVNQSVNSGQWNPLGIYPFAEGPAGGSVVISSDGANAGTSNVGPVADAVRFQYLGELLTPSAAFASSTNTTNTFRPPANVINGSGMSDANGDGIPDTHAANEWGDNINWMSNTGDTAGWFAIDLGDPYQLFRANVYNFNAESGRTNRGVGLADIYVSMAEAPALGDFSDPSVWRLVAEGMSFAQASGTNSYNTPGLIDLDGQWARWFALDIKGNLGDANFVGLSEIQFFGVPEPGSLLLGAMGMLGLLMLGRRRKPTAR